MCQILWWGEQEIQSVGELRQRMPKLVKSECYRDIAPDDHCLCSVDLEATGEANGVKIVPNGTGDFEVKEQ